MQKAGEQTEYGPSHQPEPVALSGVRCAATSAYRCASRPLSSSVIVAPAWMGGKGLGNLLLTSAGRFPVSWGQRGRIWRTAADSGLWFYTPGPGGRVGNGLCGKSVLGRGILPFPTGGCLLTPTPRQHPPLGRTQEGHVPQYRTQEGR